MSAQEAPFSPHILTPVQGGHVWPGTWEKLQWQHSVECAACGASLRSNGLRVLRPLGEGLCQGWRNPSARPVLPDLVRGMTREAPDDKPNGPSEEAILNLHEKQLAATGPHDGIKMIVSVARNLAASDAVGRLSHALADDARALRLALEHDDGADGKAEVDSLRAEIGRLQKIVESFSGRSNATPDALDRLRHAAAAVCNSEGIPLDDDMVEVRADRLSELRKELDNGGAVEAEKTR